MSSKGNSGDQTAVSFEEAVIYLLGGVFVLYLSNGGIVEIAIIVLVWLLSISSKRIDCCCSCQNIANKKVRGSESDTDEENIE